MQVTRTGAELGERLVELRAGREGRLGLVPTMGGLHAGHMSLVERARRENELVGVSIFVNPLQFGPGEDLGTYPRTEEQDLALLERAAVDLVLCARDDDFYPEGFQSSVEVSGALVESCEAAARPGHFRGVTTVVAKLFLLFQPERAYFGWKDMQQFCVLHRMVEDLCFPIEMIACEVVRDDDGLALSSRNAYLSPGDRARAPAIHRALTGARRLFQEGERSAAALTGFVEDALGKDFAVDYVEIRDEESFLPVADPVDGGRVVVAARLGGVRLLDSMALAGTGTGSG